MERRFNAGDRVYVTSGGIDWPLGRGRVTGHNGTGEWVGVELNRPARRHNSDTAQKHWICRAAALLPDMEPPTAYDKWLAAHPKPEQPIQFQEIN